MQDNDLYLNATRNVERKIGFFIHLLVYLVVNSVLLTINYRQHIGVPWSFGPLFGWGIGLLVHGLSVFLHTAGAGWRQRMIAKELDHLKTLPTP